MQKTHTSPFIQAVQVSKRYPGAVKPVLEDVNLQVQRGEFLAILGRSGSGKSTLLNTLSSLVLPDSGSIYMEGTDICKVKEKERNRLRSHTFAMVFQQHHLLPYLTALENVLLPFMGGLGHVTKAQRQAALDMLENVGLQGKENSRPGTLSGGEQQRVAIARALARGAKVLFADEPTGSLDSVTGDAIMQLLHSLNKQGVTVIMVSHNPEYARQAQRMVTMQDGRIVGIAHAPNE
ncbi:ABC transporter ATP-binding protein [Desulfovibrio cuneatus]|uniref:ABC transporter ATP-binding protein n=1 Tax=Desulfovibrio cuneatus TaxID=159728 RepID=UPI000411CC67|nr:ABC transporter ATP-binding protein [Desulfovibrio cuneatus]